MGSRSDGTKDKVDRTNHQIYLARPEIMQCNIGASSWCLGNDFSQGAGSVAFDRNRTPSKRIHSAWWVGVINNYSNRLQLVKVDRPILRL
jgi:hypothetical protein